MRYFLSVFAVLIVVYTYSQEPLPTATSTLFSGAGVCESCHIAEEGVLQTSEGRDISPVTLWRSTMMANASKDPLWQAKVSAESMAHPALQSVIETKCTSCHAPMGKTEAFYHGASSFLLTDATEDPLSMDGVSCTLCHQIRNEGLSHDSTFSANYPINDSHEIFGPYENPVAQPMINMSGFEPVFSEHISNSRVCATCHTLFTPFLDNEGNIAGTFPEQTPFLEWRNSNYVGEKSCQDCHMPAVDEAMKISVSPPWLSEMRNPIYEHELTGGNAFMGRILKDNIVALQISALPQHLDSTISKSKSTLQSAIATSMESEISDDSLRLSITLENLSGHKFPTGFPSRRAWVYLRIENGAGIPVFESGEWDEDGIILPDGEAWQTHHNIITDENQVQIYQALMKDVDEDLTYILLRGAAYLKDNRIPPAGYIPGGPDEVNIAIHGSASQDEDFNRFSGGEHGSGADVIRYAIPVNSATEFNVFVKVCYQSLDPHFADDLFAYDTPQANAFETMYGEGSNEPEIIAEMTAHVEMTGVQGSEKKELNFIPNPTSGKLMIEYHGLEYSVENLSLFDLSGAEIPIKISNSGVRNIDISSLPSGVYIFKYLDQGENLYGKVIKR